MPSICQKRQWKFSSFHGSNVRLTPDSLVAQGYYLEAHGQFILENELYPGQSFDLEFRGTGILKLQAFQSKYEAEQWFRSKKTLGKGSIRIRTKKTLRYNVCVPPTGSSIILSTRKKEERQDKLNGNILAFDIEYGDVIVMILKEYNSSNVKFHSTCHSQHVDIVNSPRVSHASLTHYNPTSLCTPFDLTVRPGEFFQLVVTGPDDEKTTGSYVRVCLSRKHNEYSNDQERFEGTRNTPEFKGKRMLVKPRAHESFILRVEDKRIYIERKGTQILHIDAPIKRGDFGLWFEVHKANLQFWLLRVKIDSGNQQNGLHHVYGLPPLPPPRTNSRECDTGYCTDSDSSQMATEHHYLSLHSEDIKLCTAHDGTKTGNSSQLQSSDSDTVTGQSCPPDYVDTVRQYGERNQDYVYNYDNDSCEDNTFNDLAAMRSDSETPTSVINTTNFHNNITACETPDLLQTSLSVDSGSSFFISYHPESRQPEFSLNSSNTSSTASLSHSMSSNTTFGFHDNLNQNSEDNEDIPSKFIGAKVSCSDRCCLHSDNMNVVKTLNKQPDDNSDTISQYSEYTIDDSTYVKCPKTST